MFYQSLRQEALNGVVTRLGVRSIGWIADVRNASVALSAAAAAAAAAVVAAPDGFGIR